MFIDQVLYPVEALGPGKRIGIWVVGCHRGCLGCSNPELWSTENRESVSVANLVQVISAICEENQVDGFTISGGEPMNQPEELLELVEKLSSFSQDILVFSGYTYEELLDSEDKAQVLDYIAVLVDGPYIQENNQRLVLRGSTNQRILLFEPELEAKYLEYLGQKQSSIQNLHFEDETISIGIHERNFSEEITRKLREYGIRSTIYGADEVAQ